MHQEDSSFDNKYFTRSQLWFAIAGILPALSLVFMAIYYLTSLRVQPVWILISR